MYPEGETNPYFRSPLQPELHEDHHSRPTSPLVQPPRHETQFLRPLQPESRQDRPFRPTNPLVKQHRSQRKHSKLGQGPQPKSKPPHPGQLQPTNPRVQEPPSQPSGGLVPPLQLQGQHPQPPGLQGPRQGHRQSHLWQPRNQPTKDAFTWFATVFCAIFWVVIIVGGIIVLIVYLVYRPRSPQFAVSSATLNAAYLDMGYLLNADVTLLANFTNPSKRVSVDFSYMYINLYYGSTLIATQYIEPFSAARGVSRFANVHMVTSQVRLPLGESRRLQRQMESNGVMFEVKSFLRTRSNFGRILRYSYWLHGQCTILLTGPPDGVMIRSKCKTKR